VQAIKLICVFYANHSTCRNTSLCQTFAVPGRNCSDFLRNLRTVGVMRNTVVSKSVILVPLSTNQEPP